MSNKNSAADSFGARLKAAREASGLTITDVANRMGVTQQSVSAWEHDQREPRANKVLMLSGILGVGLPWLLQGSGKGPNTRSAELELEQIDQQLASLRRDMTSLSRSLDNTSKKVAKLLKRTRDAREKAQAS